MKRSHMKAALVLAALLSFNLTVLGADVPKVLPDPDGKPAEMTKPVQVYILLGQSNMLGAGRIAGDRAGTLEHAVKAKKKYPYLVDDAGNWTVRKDVRYVRVMGSGTGRMGRHNNEWMTIKVKGRGIGPEYGIGHYVGHATDAPVMILKSCIGNRSLGWDLLPPGSERYEVEEKDRRTGQTKTFVYAGYKDSPAKWEKGTEPKKIGWYAGMQYDGDIANAKTVLAPKAKFVVATLGQTKKGKGGNEGTILEAQLAVDGKTGKYPEFKGNVASVYSNPFCHGGASNSHYGGNAETYMDVGEAMGRAMAELIGTSDGSSR